VQTELILLRIRAENGDMADYSYIKASQAL